MPNGIYFISDSFVSKAVLALKVNDDSIRRVFVPDRIQLAALESAKKSFEDGRGVVTVN